jgi:hypothetical protein
MAKRMKTSLAKKTSKKTLKKSRRAPAKSAGKNAAEKVFAARSDKGAPASVAIERMAEPKRAIARALDKAIRSLSKSVDAQVRWGNAGYWIEGHDMFALSECADRVNLYVAHGASLPDPAGLLEGSGKSMRHVKVRSEEVAKSSEVLAILRASLDAAKRGAGGAWDRIKSKK